jgi:hypothetical protein
MRRMLRDYEWQQLEMGHSFSGSASNTRHVLIGLFRFLPIDN